MLRRFMSMGLELAPTGASSDEIRMRYAQHAAAKAVIELR